MSIGIYTEPNSESLLSQNGEFTKPFSIAFDGRLGGYKETRLFIRNNDLNVFYTGLTLSLSNPTGTNIVNNGEFQWKLSYGDTKPTFNDWLNIAPANTMSIENLGSAGNPDISTFLPFWLFIQIPSNLSVQVFTGVTFSIEGNEELA